MGVTKNRGTPNWMVNIMENPIKKDDLGGNPLFSETSIWRVIYRESSIDHRHLRCQVLQDFLTSINQQYGFLVAYDPGNFLPDKKTAARLQSSTCFSKHLLKIPPCMGHLLTLGIGSSLVELMTVPDSLKIELCILKNLRTNKINIPH